MDSVLQQGFWIQVLFLCCCFSDTLGMLILFNNSLYSVVNVSIIILSALQILSYLILITTLRVRYYYYPHYRDKETEAQRGQFAQGHKASEWWSQNSQPSNLAPLFLRLTTFSIPLALDLNTLEATLEMKHWSPLKS